MGSEWPIAKLGDYCTKIGSGSTPRGGSKVYLDEGDICLIRSQNVYNEGFKSEGLVYITEDAAEKLKNVVVEENDVLLNITGDSVARVCLAKNEYLPARVNQHVAIIRPNPEEFDPRYIRYLLASPYMQELLLTMASSGATRNALTKGMIEVLEIPKPAIDVQRRIADHLSVLDDKIELNTQTNQTLEQIAQAIFKSWFVDFDPVRAKMAVLEEGGIPETAERAAMRAISGKDDAALEQMQRETPEAYARLTQTAALFPSAMEESELGEIPEGWEYRSIYEISNIVYGAPFKSKQFNTESIGIPLVRIRDLKNEMPGVSTEEEHPKGYLIQNGDLLVGMDGEFKPHIWGGGSAWMNQRVCCFQPKNGLSRAAIKGFIAPQLDHLEKTATATTVIHLGKGDIDKFIYLQPNTELLSVYSEIADPIYENIVENKVSNFTLAEMRDSLLPKLLSGDISVSSMEKVL